MCEVKLIEKINGKIDRKSGNKIVGKLKVGAYCRVSTDNEDQLNSYASQLSYYKEKIANNFEWSLVDIYADEAISGTLDYKRSDFLRMINDATSGKLDLIMTKSISRFARNTLDTLKYVRLLKQHNVAILFEEENINTLEMSGELLLTILSSVAQQESETISSHVKLGLKMKMQRGELIGFNGCLGYDYNPIDKSIYINETEAEIVRFIFERYRDGLGSQMISKELEKHGYKTKAGSSKWHDSTIRGILKNEKYRGDILMGNSYASITVISDDDDKTKIVKGNKTYLSQIWYGMRFEVDENLTNGVNSLERVDPAKYEYYLNEIDDRFVDKVGDYKVYIIQNKLKAYSSYSALSFLDNTAVVFGRYNKLSDKMIAYLATHEFGHNVDFQLMNDELWKEYKEIRGITDTKVYNNNSTISGNRPQEIFAEDFRLIYGCDDAKAKAHLNSNLPNPDEVEGLKAFFEQLV